MTKFLHSRPSHDVVCVLYAPGTGKIVFTHRFTFLGEKSHPSDKHLEEQARQAFKDDTAQTSHNNLAALIVPSEQFLPGHTFTIDSKKGALLAHPRAQRAE